MKFFSKRDIFTILFLLCNTLFFIYLYYDDLNKKIEDSNEESIGTVTFKMNTIQKKPGARMVYKDVYESFPLNNKDTIRTYEGSDAVITFNDGTKVKLDENSLIFFDYSDGNPSLNFEEGSIQLESNNSNLKLSSGKNEIKMDKGDFKLNKDSDDLSMVVNSGNATIKSGGKETKLTESQVANLDEKGSVAVKDLPFKLISPVDQHKELTFSEITVKFKWSSKRPSSDRFLEISKNKDFSNIVFSGQVENEKSVQLNPAVYYWRVKQKENGKFEHSDVRKLSIIQDTEVKPFTPADNENFPKSSTSISFSWSKHPLSSNYKIILSKNPNFSEIIKEVSLSSTRMMVQDLPVGTFYWKVAALPSMENADPIYTSIRKFSILDTDTVKTEEDVVLDNKEILEKSMKPNKENLVIETKKPIVFKWQDIEGTNYYEFKMYNENRDKKSPIFNTKSKKNELVLSDYSYLDQGKFFWEVNPVDNSGKKGEPAKGEFIINVEDKLKNLKPEDIKIISPDTIYRVENE
jgi:hypothetical protein